jgi:CheY-like chemotaxis protein
MDTIKRRILIIDDFEPAREFLRFILERDGFEVLSAENGEDGIALFNEKGRCDVVITDVAMPCKDGIETLIELKKIDPSIKVIVVSGAERNHRLLEIAGIFSADATITKPFTQQAISIAVQEVLTKKETIAGIPATIQ